MTARRQLPRYALLTGIIGIPLALLAIFWIGLLLDNGPGVIPNYEERMAMFRSLMRRPRRGGTWRPRQGDNWIF